MQNNPGVIVPGMPEKHVIGKLSLPLVFTSLCGLPLNVRSAGRFGSDFIENRRLGLQAALTKIVAHPMLVGDPDLRLFLESDTFHIDVSFSIVHNELISPSLTFLHIALKQIKQRKIDSSHESKGFLANLSSSISGPKFVEFDEVRYISFHFFVFSDDR